MPANALFNVFDAAQKERLYTNVAASMGGVPAEIIAREVAEFREVDPAYGDEVARAKRPATP